MGKFFSAFNTFLRTVAMLGFVGLVGVGGWVGYNAYNFRAAAEKQLSEQKKKVEELTTKLGIAEQQVKRLDMALRFSKVDHRLAQIVVVDQQPAEGDQRSKTTFSFVEVDGEGHPLEVPRRHTIDGDTLYIDAWVVKFKDELIETGDPQRSTSICLFKRLFGEFQEPINGLLVDGVGSRPAAYSRGEPMSDFEKEIWEHFWDYANDPAKAEAQGVRAAHGEAPSIQLRKGKLYKIQLRASDGLSITTEDLPAALGEPAGP